MDKKTIIFYNLIMHS